MGVCSVSTGRAYLIKVGGCLGQSRSTDAHLETLWLILISGCGESSDHPEPVTTVPLAELHAVLATRGLIQGKPTRGDKPLTRHRVFP